MSGITLSPLPVVSYLILITIYFAVKETNSNKLSELRKDSQLLSSRTWTKIQKKKKVLKIYTLEADYLRLPGCVTLLKLPNLPVLLLPNTNVGVMVANVSRTPVGLLSVKVLNIGHNIIGKTFSDINCTNVFLGQSPRTIEIKTKLNKWDLIKFISFCTAQKPQAKWKDNL